MGKWIVLQVSKGDLVNALPVASVFDCFVDACSYRLAIASPYTDACTAEKQNSRLNTALHELNERLTVLPALLTLELGRL